MRFSTYLKDSPLFLLLSVHKALEKKIELGLKDKELSMKEGFILLTLLFEKEKVGPSHLVETLGLPKAAISQSITRLEAMKLIKRTLSSQDARKTLLSLSPLGKRISNELISVFEGLDNDIEKKIKQDEFESFKFVLNSLQKSLNFI